MKNFIYLRGIRYYNHTVFCVEDKQKTYYDSMFGKMVPYSSGQQVKRSIVEFMLNEMETKRSPFYFGFTTKKQDKNKNGNNGNSEKSLPQDVVLTFCDPSYPDLLIAGWMNTSRKDKTKTNDDILDSEETLKRRSPLAISAMTALHSLAADITKETITIDRRDDADDQIMFVTDKNDKISIGKPFEFLDKYDSTQFKIQKYIEKDSNVRTTGFFKYDIAIDLRTLFNVSTSKVDRSVSEKTIEKLKNDGWKEHTNAFGSCLLCPAELREKIIPALAKGILNWMITSNQSRTFGLPVHLAVCISDVASDIPEMIRVKLKRFGNEKYEIVVDEDFKDKMFITNAAEGYFYTDLAQKNALKNAEQKLVEMLTSYEY